MHQVHQAARLLTQGHLFHVSCDVSYRRDLEHSIEFVIQANSFKRRKCTLPIFTMSSAPGNTVSVTGTEEQRQSVPCPTLSLLQSLKPFLLQREDFTSEYFTLFVLVLV